MRPLAILPSRTVSVLAATSALVVLVACSRNESATPAEAPPATLSALPSPAGTRSGEPNLSVDSRGYVHLTWLQRTSDSTTALRYAVLRDTTWSPARTVVERSDLFVNWADFPSSVRTSGGRVFVHWLQRSSAGKYSYDVRYSQSSDDGETWSEPALLNHDGTASEHGFVSLVAAPGDSVEAIWLDGRATTGPRAAHRMQLAAARVAHDGHMSGEHMIDSRTCDCCQTAAATSSRGLVVVYRDRSPDEIRDIAIVRREGDRWTEPAIVYADNWQIAACPVNGPAIAAKGDTVAVAWFTGAQDTARVRLAFSTDGGVSFAPPVRVDGGQPVGRVDVELDAEGRAVVSWLEQMAGDTAEVRVRAVSRQGAMTAPFTIASSSGKRASGFSRMVRRGNELVMAWTTLGDSSTIRVARLRPEGLKP